MRSAALPTLVALLVASGLCGCQSCVDDSSQPSSQSGQSGEPPRIRALGDSGVRIRPRLLQPPVRRLILQDAGDGDE